MTPDEQRLFDKMDKLLTDIAFALKGDPHVVAKQQGYAGMMHSWHDLPKLAQELKDENTILRRTAEEMEQKLESIADRLELVLNAQAVIDGQD